MKRILVIGCPGSGKSRFSRMLAERFNLPLCHLDMLFWKADKTTVPKEIFRVRLGDALAGEKWIIDGNYLSTLEWRLSFADTVFFFDFPLDLCLQGIEERKGKPRSDLPWIEEDGDEDEAFLSFIQSFKKETRPEILKILARNPGKKVCVFRTREEADAFLASHK